MYVGGEKWGSVCKTDKIARLLVRGVALLVGNAMYFVVLHRFIGNL
jgi:hypothetical protein